MEKRILGLDPGIAILGFGSIVCQTTENLAWRGTPSLRLSSQVITEPVRLLDFGVIETSAKTPVGDRLCTIYEDLHTLIRELQPDLVAVEKFFFYRMGNTITIAQARGVLMLVLAQAKLPYIEFAPPQIKQTLTGYGRADKQEVQAAVARELNLDTVPRPDDAADALAVALTAWYHQ